MVAIAHSFRVAVRERGRLRTSSMPRAALARLLRAWPNFHRAGFTGPQGLQAVRPAAGREGWGFMIDGFTWGQLGPIASLVLGILGLAFGIWKQRSADLRALYARIEAAKDTLTEALNDFKVEVARTHPTGRELAASEERLTFAINKLTERIDRWLERYP
jgi:hypothetical protein